MAQSSSKDRFYLYLLTSGTDLLLVCQEYPAISSTPNPHVGDYKGRIGLSPPAAYPDRPLRRYANNSTLLPRHHVYASEYYYSPYSVQDSSH